MSAQAATVPCYKLFHCCISQKLSSVRSFFPPDPQFSDAILQHVAKNREMRTVPAPLGAAPGTNGASSGLLFPSDGHSWGRSATQSWSYTLPHPHPHPLHTLPPPPPPPPPLLCHCPAPAFSLPHSARSERQGRCAWEFQTRADHRNDESGSYLPSEEGGGGDAALNCLHTAAPSRPSSPPPRGDQETDVVK